jgi:putative ABC transport system permease protein
MSWLDALRHRARTWLCPGAFERETDEEMAHHFDLDAMQKHDQASALKRYGNRAYYKEERRRAAGLHLVDGVAMDARHLLRSVRRSPAFATVVILTLAVGIGLVTAFVSIADHILLRSLPFRDADRLMMMLEVDPHSGLRTPSYPTVADWQRDPGVKEALDGVTYARGDGVRLCVAADCESIGAAFVAEEFFPLLGARPQLGRVLLADDQKATVPIAVMSHGLWQRKFGGDPTIVGRTVIVDSAAVTIVGVLPAGAVYPPFADLWRPISQYQHPEVLQRRGFHADSRTLGRLRAGVDSARAAVFMRTVGARLAAEYPSEQADWMPSMIPIQRELLGNVGTMLWTMSAAAIAVLLLACANVAGLLLARLTSRGRELALRSAIGASRRRVVRQLLTESLVLSALGGIAGATLAFWSVNVSRSFLAQQLPRIEELSVDWRVLSLAAGATLLTALMCGLWPAVLATRTRGTDALQARGIGAIGAPAVSRLRRVFVTMQFALALVLLVCAGLLVQSFRRAADVDIGFDATGIVTFRVQPPSSYAEPATAAALYLRLMDAVKNVPGVVDAAFINHAPFGSAAITTTLTIDGRSTLDSSNQIFYRTVSSNYLSTMRMTMRSGRWFNDADERTPGGAFVINETMARLYWPGSNALNQRLTVTRASQSRKDFGQPLSGAVIGVVADVHQASQDAAPAPEVYVPYTLETWPWGMLIVRARDARRSIPSLVRAVRSVEPRLIQDGAAAEADFGVMQEAITNTLQPRLLSIKFIGAFAACALVLACIGMSGVVAYNIAQRTREIGVRKALGATSGSIFALILRESSVIICLGTLAGAIGGWASARLIRGMLFNTTPVDVMAYSASIALLAIVALSATVIPARRALKLDPIGALRTD